MSARPHRMRGGARRGLRASLARALALAVLGLTVLAAGCSAGPAARRPSGAGSSPGTGPTVAVPDVVGSAQANAVQALAGVGLKPGKITSQQTTVAPPDEVASQKPPAGTLVKPGSLVDLVVAEAPVIGTPVKVPAIVGLDYKVAAKKLAEAGLSYKALYDSASDRPQGSIVSQDPEAGQTVPKGTVVGVTISLSAVPPKP